MPKSKFHVGDKSGMLTVLSCPGRNRFNQRLLLCKCDCGAVTLIPAFRLPKIKSCGCLQAKTASKATAIRNYKHGHSRSPEYNIWHHIWDRCTNSACRVWHRYGGRGIRVDPRWKDFTIFIRDVGSRPSKLHSLDRINNDGNYEPGNVRWATQKIQANNTSRNKIIHFQGQSKTVSEWADLLGFSSSSVIWTRLKLGWSISKILSTPPLARKVGTT